LRESSGAGSAEPFEEILGWDRPAPEVTPGSVAFQLAQAAELLRGFDRFGDRGKPEGVGEVDRRPGNHGCRPGGSEINDECAVELQGVDREPVEIGERGVPGAEVVKR